MLYTETVEKQTFDLLKTLMQEEILKNFNLAGGTALALYLGYRKSVDLDLFTPYHFDAKNLEEYLTEKYNLKVSFMTKNTLKGTIDDVKIDCIAHRYEYLAPPFLSKEGIRLYSIKDIAAMKLSAISDDGTRAKDFVDIAYLSSKLSLEDMLDAYEKKFPNSNPIRPLKALTYFQDINYNEPVLMVKGSLNWAVIKERLYDMIRHTDTLFPLLEMNK